MSFNGVYSKLWTIWELLIVGEPVLVAASNPQTCGDAVLAMVSLVSPLEFAGECRPFFTMHDSDFKHYSETGHPEYDSSLAEPTPENSSDSSSSTPAGTRLGSVVVGVTNPYFFKAFEHWPHIITIADENGAGGAVKRKNPATTPKRSSINSKSSFRSFSEYKTSLDTKYKPFYEFSKELVAELKKMATKAPAGTPPKDERQLLKHHFRKLTEAFLLPLELYFKSLLSVAEYVSSSLLAQQHLAYVCFAFYRQMSLLGGVPAIKPFREASFLSQLLDAGSVLFSAAHPFAFLTGTRCLSYRNAYERNSSVSKIHSDAYLCHLVST